MRDSTLNALAGPRRQSKGQGSCENSVLTSSQVAGAKATESAVRRYQCCVAIPEVPRRRHGPGSEGGEGESGGGVKRSGKRFQKQEPSPLPACPIPKKLRRPPRKPKSTNKLT